MPVIISCRDGELPKGQLETAANTSYPSITIGRLEVCTRAAGRSLIDSNDRTWKLKGHSCHLHIHCRLG
jgi:hypothetical protein